MGFSMSIICACMVVYSVGTSYYALWKARQQRLQSVNAKYVASSRRHSQSVPATAYAPTAATPGYTTTETETETNLSLREQESQKGSTGDDDVWASATTSPTGQFPVTSFTEDGNPVTSFVNGNSPDAGPPEKIERAADGESHVTSFVNNGDSVTSFDNRMSPETNGASSLTNYEDSTVRDSHVTSLTVVGNHVTPFTNEGHFLDSKLTGSCKCAAEESPLTSSTKDRNPITSYSVTASSPTNDEYQASGANSSTGNSYLETGSSVMKLVLEARNDDRPMILHRIQIPTVGEVLAEVGVVEQSSIESAGSAATTTDYSVAVLRGSMLDMSNSRDMLNRDGDQNDQTGTVWTITNDQSVLSEPANNATTLENDSGLEKGMQSFNANDTRTRNLYRKPVPENLYRFSASVSCESVSIFSGTEIWYGVEQCSTRCRKP